MDNQEYRTRHKPDYSVTKTYLPYILQKICHILVIYHKGGSDKAMAQAEQPEKYNWWLNELESLGINRDEVNEIDDHKAEDLAEAVKQTLYEEYLQAYNER